ncbi:MAG: endoglucanase-related protein glucosyl hydrolase family 9 protein [Chloroflexota bacterium]
MQPMHAIHRRVLTLLLAVMLVVVAVVTQPFVDTTAEAGVRSAGRAGFLNGSFESDADGSTSVTNWTIVGAGIDNRNGPYPDKIDLGVTVLGGCVSQDTTDYAAIAATGATPSLAVWRDDNSFNPQGLNASNWLTTESYVSTSMASGVPIVAGNKVLYMNNMEYGGSAYRVIHGPAVVSDVFSADAGYEITFDWYAQYVRDNFAILGYLLDTSTCTQTEIVDATGRLVSGWQNSRITIPATSSTYRFVFVNGTFDQSGGTNSGATMYIDNISVGMPQTINFVLPATINKTLSPYTLPATATSTLAVTYTSSTPSVCTVSGGAVTIVATSGTCTLVAHQIGGTSGSVPYASAVDVTQSFTVTNYLPQTITFGALPDKEVTDPDFTLSATASSTLPVSYTSSTTSVCTVSGSTVNIVSSGTCTIVAAQAGGTTGGNTYLAATNVTQSFLVKTAQTITFGALPDKSTTDAEFSLGATASSTLPVTYVSNSPSICTVSGGKVQLVGPGTCSITAKQAGGTSGGVVYGAAPDVTQTFVVKQGQTITFPAIPKKNYQTPDFDPNATASSTLPVSYTSTTPSVCSIVSGKIRLLAVGSCSVTASQAGGSTGGTTYSAAQPVTRAFDVIGMPQTIATTAVPQKYSYDPDFDLAASATSGLDVEYESLNPAICTVTGKKVKIVGMGTCYVKVKQKGGTATDGTIYDAAPDATIVINISNATATSTPTATKTATPTPNKYALKKAAVGASFVLGLLYNNTLVTWGMNKEYQANIPPCCGSNITDISVGTNFAVALKGGRVYGWGSNTRGQITIPLMAQKDVIAIASGYAHTLALKSNGSVVCWGNNLEKQCNIPKSVKNVAQVAGGKDFSLALLKSGTVFGWGGNGSGQIRIPVGLKNVKAITAGCTHALALKKDGYVVGWGSNAFNEAKVPLNLKDVKEIGAGCNYSMAMMNDGTLFGWGRNEYNQITIPEGITNAEHIGVGYVNSIITLRNSVVLAIGAPEHDALVSRTPTLTVTPTP